MCEFIFLILTIIANLTVTYFGIIAVYINAAVTIPADMFLRDKIHEKWHNTSYFWVKFVALFLVGGILSFLLNRNSYNVAIASFLAFFVSNLIDTFIYNIYFKRTMLFKMNVSNLFSSILDAVIFITIVFGFRLDLIFVQFALKFVSGTIFSYLYTKHRDV